MKSAVNADFAARTFHAVAAFILAEATGGQSVRVETKKTAALRERLVTSPKVFGSSAEA
jgi:hypothetical protein